MLQNGVLLHPTLDYTIAAQCIDYSSQPTSHLHIPKDGRRAAASDWRWRLRTFGSGEVLHHVRRTPRKCSRELDSR